MTVHTVLSTEFKSARGRLASLAHWHPEKVTEIAALKAEVATLTLLREIDTALAKHGPFSADQKHRIASRILGGGEAR